MIERYAVYWVALDPVVGSEISKTRPAIVISDNEMNNTLNTVVVCPLTSRIHTHWPSRVQVLVDGERAEIAVDQIRIIDKKRLGAFIDRIPETAAAELHLFALRSLRLCASIFLVFIL